MPAPNTAQLCCTSSLPGRINIIYTRGKLYGKSRVLTSGEARGQAFVPHAMPNSPRDYTDLYSDLKGKQAMWPVTVVIVDPDTAAAPSNWVDSGLE